jgi:uncharacterized protein (TIGR02996 family)
MPIDQELASARLSLEAGKTDAALKSLSAAWRTLPSPELLELACAVAPPEPLKAAKGKETTEALQTARKAKPDPRVSKALEQLLTDVPWTADSSKPVWRAAFELVGALKDPRWVGLAATLPAQWKFRAPMVAWMGAQLKKAVAPLAAQQVPALSDAQKTALKALHAAMPKKKAGKPEGRDGAALLAAVHADPADDAPRRVFADHLQEQGDPRGEFITLQLAEDAASAKQAQKLLAAHGKNWLDGLTLAKDVRFRRGFLSSVKVTFKNQGEAEKYGALPAWATIEELELASTNNANDQRTWGQTIPQTAVSLKALRGLDGHGIENLVTRNTPLPLLETLEGHVHEFEEWRALTTTTLLPRLRTLDVSGVKGAWLAKAPPPAHWRQITTAWEDLGLSYRAFSATKLPTYVWHYRDWASFEFSRGPQGDLSRLVLRMTKGNTPKMVKTWLEQLPAGCLEVFEVEGETDDSVKVARKRLVRAGGAAAPVVSGPERTLGAAIVIAPGPDGHVWWADRSGLVELDARGKVVRDVIPASWSSAVFSSDGKRVFAGGADVVEIFETRTGQRLEKNTVPCSTSYVRLSLSHDGKVLAAPMNPGVSVSWPGTTKKPVVYGGASCFALTPDGKVLIRCDLTWDKGAIQLHPVGEKARGVKFAKDSAEFSAVACAPDGATFVTANKEDELQLWDLASKHQVKSFEGTKGVIRLSFSADGQRLAAGGANQTWVFEVASGKKTTLKGGGNALAWTSDGKLLRASDQTLVLG